MSAAVVPSAATVASIRSSRATAGSKSAAEPNGHWVEAAPFRAYLRHLIDSSGLPWQEVAAVARISVPDARRLLTGRHGKTARRISPETARRLFWIDQVKLSRAATARSRQHAA